MNPGTVSCVMAGISEVKIKRKRGRKEWEGTQKGWESDFKKCNMFQ